jgi:hypothetical protein
MVDAAGSLPLKIRSLARSLAELHSSLHAIAAPEWLHDAPFGTGDRILHMDLHPLNDAVAWKCQDPNMSAPEMERMHSLASTA